MKGYLEEILSPQSDDVSCVQNGLWISRLPAGCCESVFFCIMCPIVGSWLDLCDFSTKALYNSYIAPENGGPLQKEIPMVSTIIFRVHIKFWRGNPQPKPVHKIWISVETFHTKRKVRPTETRQNARSSWKRRAAFEALQTPKKTSSIKVAHGDPEGEPHVVTSSPKNKADWPP